MRARAGRRGGPGRLGICWLFALTLAGAPRPVRANGAFPDAMEILLPTGKPDQILLGTNFGLVISDDGGQTWTWSCEQMASTNGSLYQLGPVPMERVYAISQYGLVFTDDASCTWAAGGGSLANLLATDAFVDPTNQARVWAVAHPVGSTSVGTGIYRSDDGGVTFGSSLYDFPLPGGLISIESARSDPDIVYAALYEDRPCQLGDGGSADAGDADADGGDAGDAATLCPSPRLIRSGDAGAHWDDPIDLQPALGRGMARIIAVDPTDPRRLFLRFAPFDTAGERLMITDDGGQTFRQAFRVGGRLTAFLRRADGTILASGLEDAGPVGFRSSDGGASFTPWPGIPSLRGLAERGGRIYGSADFVKDGYALGVSSDGGNTFAPVMTFSQVKAIRACVQAACQDACEFKAGITLWPPETCGGPPPAQKTGCSCAAADAGAAASALSAAILFAACAMRAGLRRRR